jgi:hypothetical protein
MSTQTSPASKTCSFAMSGTYGHECGAPAVLIAVQGGSKLTHSGLFYTGRCAKCAQIKGGENARTLRLEPIANQVNDWNGRYN